MEKEKKDNSFMMKLSTLIVDKRKGFYLVFILLILYSVLSMNRVKVNNDPPSDQVPAWSPWFPADRKSDHC